MGILARLSNLITANVNALLDRAEDPAKLIAQVIRQMEDGLADARRYAAMAIAAERRLRRELDQNRTQAQLWRARALTALTMGRKELARRMSARKKEHDALDSSLESQHAETAQTTVGVRIALRALEARLAEVRRKQRWLLARQGAARVRAAVYRTGTGLAGFHAAQVHLERLENRLVEFEDEVAGQAELAREGGALEGELADAERERDVNAELAELEHELRGSRPQLATPP
jgi:phage shock protein A